MPEDYEDDEFEGEPRRFEVQLFIVHPTMTPSEITAELGLEAHFSHRVGDMRIAPNGKVIGGKYPDTRWRYCVGYEVRNQWFADKIALLVDSLMPYQSFFARVRATGGSSDVILWFLGDRGYFGDRLSAETVAKLAELRLGFSIECFAVPQN